MAIDKQALKLELMFIAKQQIINGVPPLDLKNQLKAKIKQRVKNDVLAQQIKAPKKSVGGFFSNLKNDVSEVVQGIGALGGMLVKGIINTVKEPFLPGTQSYVGKLVKEPSKTLSETGQKAKEMGNLLLDEYKEYRHPIEKAYEDPLDVFLDIITVLSLGGGLITKGGVKTATVAPKFGKALTTTGKIIQAPAKAVTFKGIVSNTRKLIGVVPGGKGLLQGLDDWASINKLMNSSQRANIFARNRAIHQVDDVIKKLKPEEVNSLIPSAQGLVTVVNPSENFQKALGLTRALAKERELFGLQIGSLTPEQVLLRKYKPLAKQLGLTGEKGILSKTQLNTIKKIFPDADPVYIQHMFADTPKNFADYFLNTNPTRNYKPGFLKKFTGTEGYIGEAGAKIAKEELAGVFKKEAIQTLKWKNNIKLIDDLLKNPTVKAYKIGQELLPGHKVFAPNGLLRFYKGKINLSDEIARIGTGKAINTADDIFSVLKEAIDNVFPGGADFTKEYLGVTKKVKLYQVPEAVARQLTKAVQPSNPFVKLLWDKPMDAFRYSVLALSPRWLVNNFAGNTTFSMMTGDLFDLPIKEYKKALKAGLIPDEVFTGLFRMERTTSGNLGKAADIINEIGKAGKGKSKIIDGLVLKGEKVFGTLTKPIRKIGEASFYINQVTDDFFRGTHFINKVIKDTRKKFITSTAKSFDDTFDVLQKGLKNPKIVQEAVDSVNKWFYGAANLTNLERRVFRRVIPFYSWMRWITEYSIRLPLEAPARANLLRNIGKATYVFTGQDRLPDYLRGSIPIGTSDDGSVYYLRSSGANPFSTINELVTFGLSGSLIQAAAPGIKTVYEQATGKEAFPISAGKEFTIEDLTQVRSGRLYTFNPESGEVEEVNEVVRPNLLENLLRNFIPQYLLLEKVLTGGRRRYTAEGLLTILNDLRLPEEERKSIIKDSITLESEKNLKKLTFDVASLGGVPIYEWTAQSQKYSREELEEATNLIFNKENPMFKSNFKNQLKERIIKEFQKGTSTEELKLKVKSWIIQATPAMQ